MEDKTLMDTGMGFSEKIMDAANDLIQALLAALSKTSTPEQKHLLEEFADYVYAGGTLQTIQFGKEQIESFDYAAKKFNLAYYAIGDKNTDQTIVIIKERDTKRLEQAAAYLAENNSPLFPNPQLSLSDFLAKYKEEEIVFIRMESLEQAETAKSKIVEKNQNIEFTVGKTQDNSYLMIFLHKDSETLKELGLIDKTKIPSPLAGTSTLQEIKQRIEDQKQRRKTENKKNEGKVKSHDKRTYP